MNEVQPLSLLWFCKKHSLRFILHFQSNSIFQKKMNLYDIPLVDFEVGFGAASMNNEDSRIKLTLISLINVKSHWFWKKKITLHTRFHPPRLLISYIYSTLHSSFVAFILLYSFFQKNPTSMLIPTTAIIAVVGINVEV